MTDADSRDTAKKKGDSKSRPKTVTSLMRRNLNRGLTPLFWPSRSMAGSDDPRLCPDGSPVNTNENYFH
jgi:hypothetical protein